MKLKEVCLVAVGAALTVAGCSQETTDEGYGSASVAALTSSDVDYVVITVENPPRKHRPGADS